MSPITKAREAVRQAGEQYGRRAAEIGSSLSEATVPQDTNHAHIRVVLQHIDKQAEKLIGKGMAAELVQLWTAAATQAATERMHELFPLIKASKRSVN
ncbi:hypothetical protein [Microvirga aerophila]|uniref:Uncharacterized protein n=1 Tax=Microvirga aerophila TaxID=670291 RepID=A0A512C1J0_9HYPH|nr:hypothetical protein [Microvirga aerophila]GEO18071.1 hypothetical protein MAE02_57670 [Microvirga aerophila]